MGTHQSLEFRKLLMQIIISHEQMVQNSSGLLSFYNGVVMVQNKFVCPFYEQLYNCFNFPNHFFFAGTDSHVHQI